MIQHLDRMIGRVLVNEGVATKVSFEPPVQAWRNALLPNDGVVVNAYLVDLHEKREMRQSGADLSPNGRRATSQALPAFLECHYLLSAWSPAADGDVVQPSQEEHRVLYAVAEAFVRATPLNAARVAGLTPPVDELIRERDLPTEVLPASGFPKLPEFWAGMGAESIWRPAVYLIVTLPIAFRPRTTGPLVTTVITRYSASEPGAQVETWVQIAGRVLFAGTGVTGAWVRLDSGGLRVQTTETEEHGRFDFVGLSEGSSYTLTAGAPGLNTRSQQILVPNETGVYDLVLTKP